MTSSRLALFVASQLTLIESTSVMSGDTRLSWPYSHSQSYQVGIMMADLGQIGRMGRMGPWAVQLEYGPPKPRSRCYQTLTNVCQSLQEVTTMDDEGLSPEVASAGQEGLETVGPEDGHANPDIPLEYRRLEDLMAKRTAEARMFREKLSRNGPFGGRTIPVEYQGDTKAPYPYERQEEVEDPTARPTKSDEVAERHEKQEKEHQEREHQHRLQEYRHRFQEYEQGFQKYQQGFREFEQDFQEYEQGFQEYLQDLVEYQQGFQECLQDLLEYQRGLQEYQKGFQEHEQGLQEYEQDLQEHVLDSEQVDVIMQKEKTHEFKDNESAPTYTRMMRKHLSLESLRIFEIDYTIDDQVRFPPRL